MKDIDKIINEMTLEEKAGLCSGLDFWHTKPIERLGVPSVMVSDGPNGLRAQKADADHLGLGKAVTAVCYPTGSALGASFDPELVGRLGSALASAARQEGIHTVLGPAVNMKRSPLCGRNFEYISEDPCNAGKIASSYVDNMQKGGVGVCVKHFAANNQEYNRMSTDTVVSERALREIYLSAFEQIVKESKPWSLMCAYNKINGTYCCENSWLLDEVLRKEWGFDGIVMTDWGAMNNRVEALAAGLELEMPSSNGLRDRQIVAAVKEGRLDEKILDRTVKRLLEWISKGADTKTAEKELTLDDQHELAREIAENSAVLLKNENDVLPLEKGRKIAFIGTFAISPRYQGGGSSHVTSYKVTNAFDSSVKFADIIYYAGWKEGAEERDEALVKQAVEGAENAECVVIFAGLPDSYESEGFDRKHINLPECQNELIEKIAAVQENVVIVLQNGSPVAMPWLGKVSAVLELNLAGEASGEAAADLLFGVANPSGHLAETYPLCLEDNSSYISFPGSGKKVVYREDVFIGYRWYDSLSKPVLFPFGHGLSYTSFSLSDIKIDNRTVSAVVTNTGKRDGAQVVQLYVKPPRSADDRPVHELKDFVKVQLAPGENRSISFVITDRMLSYYSENEKDWVYDEGTYIIELGFSSRDIKCEMKLDIKKRIGFTLTDSTTVGDVLSYAEGKELPSFIKEAGKCFGVGTENEGEAVGAEAAYAMFMELPVHSIASFLPVNENYLEELEKILRE